MIRLTFLWAILLFSGTLFAQQSSISGTVTIHNSQYETGQIEYVRLAQVEEDFGRSQATTTDDEGQFKLMLVNLADQESFSFSVSKEGLDVVNWDQLEAIAGQKKEVRISMAIPRKIAEFRKQIYRVGRTEAEKKLAANLEQTRNALQEEQNKANTNEQRVLELQQELDRLTDAYQTIDQQARALAEKYTRINLDDVSTLYQDAFRLFQEGDLERALELLQQADYTKQTKDILEERKRIETIREEAQARDVIQQQQTEEVMQALLFKADLHKTRFEFDSVETAFQLLVELDSTKVENLATIAAYYGDQKQQQRAIALYQQGLRHCQSESQRAKLLVGLANQLRLNEQFGEAESAFLEALSLHQRLDQSHPNRYKLSLAINKVLLGGLYRGLNKHELAIENTSNALNDLASVQDVNKLESVYYQSVAYHNLGSIYDDLNDFDQARDAYQKALEIRKQLVATDADRFDPMLAETYNNMGVMYSNLRKYKEAEAFYQDALQIRKRLVQTNPNRFEPDLADTYTNIGVNFMDQKDYDSAEPSYQEASTIYQKLAQSNLRRYEPYVALITNNLAILYQNKGAFQQSENHYQKVLEIRSRLAKQNPDRYNNELADTHTSIGLLYRKSGDHEKSLTSFLKALDIRKELASKYPDRFKQDLAEIQNNLANAYIRLQKVEEAESGYLEALSIYQELSVKDPEFYSPYLARSFGNLSSFYIYAEKFKKAERAAKEGLEIGPDFTWININLANALLLQGKYSQAEAIYTKFKDQDLWPGLSFKDAFLGEFKKLEASGLGHEDMGRIRELLGD